MSDKRTIKGFGLAMQDYLDCMQQYDMLSMIDDTIIEKIADEDRELYNDFMTVNDSITIWDIFEPYQSQRGYGFEAALADTAVIKVPELEPIFACTDENYESYILIKTEDVKNEIVRSKQFAEAFYCAPSEVKWFEIKETKLLD